MMHFLKLRIILLMLFCSTLADIHKIRHRRHHRNRPCRSVSPHDKNDPDKEPCQFGSYKLRDSTIIERKIPSWCTCEADLECLFAKWDAKKKVNIYHCVSNDELLKLFSKTGNFSVDS